MRAGDDTPYDFDRLSAHDRAEILLALVDADVARHYVYDGQLSTAPLDGSLSPTGVELRAARLAAVAELERQGGRDPHPLFLREPTPEQRAALRLSRSRWMTIDEAAEALRKTR